jgi:AraC family transcriptional regulator
MTGGIRGSATRRAPPTSIHFVRASSGEPVPHGLNASTIVASSRGLGWDGIVAEMGRELNWQADDLTVAGHFIAINLAAQPLCIENKGAHGFRRVTMPPDSVWINPAGRPFTRRNPGVTRYGVIEISAERMRRTLGCDVDLRYACGVTDEPLAAAVRALILEAKTGGSSGPLFADGLGIAVAARLSRRFGRPREADSPRGALASRLKTVLEKMEDTMAASITVAELATVAGLSPAHFAREFKRCTHWTPHAFLMERRVQRARQMLAAGQSIAETAFACGFADQSHLGRVFKTRFGVTPSAFVRAARGEPRSQ